MVFDSDEVVERSFLDHATTKHNADAVADFLNLLQKVRGQNNRNAAGFQIEDEVSDFSRPGWVNAGRGFVQNDEARVMNEGLGEPDALEHAF